ncbi:MAG: GGDEF domain-containing protein, partial [Solirubrobacteraceae bacterium]
MASRATTAVARRPVPALGTALLTIALALVAAAVVAVAGGGTWTWLCLPLSLVAVARARGRAGAGGALIVIVAPSELVARSVEHGGGAPPPLALLVIAAACAVVVIELRERLGRERETMREFALRDAVTGIANRRSLLIRASYEVERHRRTRRSFALVMLDLDGFKRLNDRFGHGAGDEILRDVADALARALRAQDTVARLGGDEFCVLAPETDRAGTGPLAARIERAIAGATAGIDALSATVGISLFPGDGRTVAGLI